MRDPPSENAIIIVGAGPAGLSTALHLAQRAPHLVERTLILEQARHPRPKLCAGGLLPDALRCLARLELDLGEIRSLDVPWGNFYFNGRGFRLQFDTGYLFQAVRRAEFDAWLAEKARARGFRLQEATTVKGVDLQERRVRVETDRGTYRAQVVVGADGALSVVRRAVTDGPGNLARLLEVHLRQRPEDPRAGGEAYLDFGCIADGIQGYVWDFPTPGDEDSRRTWGVYDSRAVNGAPKGDLVAALEAALQAQGYAPESYQIQGHPLRRFDPDAPFARPRVLLVGDAAGVDAAFGEGISLSLSYGEIAACALRDAFERRDFSFSGYRHRVLAHPLGRALQWRAFTARVIYHPRFRTLHPFIWRRLGALVRWYLTTFLVDWTRH